MSVALIGLGILRKEDKMSIWHSRGKLKNAQKGLSKKEGSFWNLSSWCLIQVMVWTSCSPKTNFREVQVAEQWPHQFGRCSAKVAPVGRSFAKAMKNSGCFLLVQSLTQGIGARNYKSMFCRYFSFEGTEGTKSFSLFSKFCCRTLYKIRLIREHLEARNENWTESPQHDE